MVLSGRPALANEVGIAIVVHPEVSVTDLSMDDLRRIFLAEQQFWPGGGRVTVLVGAPGARERGRVLERLYQMTEREFRKYWIAKIFRNEVPSGPKTVLTPEMARELVAAIPGAISFLPASVVTDSVKVVSINGIMPGQSGYALD